MNVARTYFLDKTCAGKLAELCRVRQDFHLENVDALDPTLARLQSLLRDNGMRSVIVQAPLNPPTGVGDLLTAAAPALGLMSILMRAAGWARRPASDATLRVTSKQSLSVVFARVAG